MCLWCADIHQHMLNSSDSIMIDEENNLHFFDRFDRLLSVMIIKYCPICGQDLRYRFDPNVKNPADEIISYVKNIQEQIDEAIGQGKYLKSTEYQNKRDGLLLALKCMGVYL